jgi:hypothetical protein
MTYIHTAWIDPNGNVFADKDKLHRHFADEILKKDVPDSVEELIDIGWLRFGIIEFDAYCKVKTFTRKNIAQIQSYIPILNRRIVTLALEQTKPLKFTELSIGEFLVIDKPHELWK